MTRCKSRLRCILLLVCAVVIPATVEAQLPGGLVRTGTLTVNSTSSRPVLTLLSLVGSSVDIHSIFDDGVFEAQQCRPCVAGSVIGVGGRIASAGRGNRFYEGDFIVTGTPLEIPAGGVAELVLTTPFRFQGRLIASPRRHAHPQEKDPPATFEGGGTVTVKFTSSINPENGERLYFFQDATYQFSPLAR
jgi:hypothetical protein